MAGGPTRWRDVGAVGLPARLVRQMWPRPRTDAATRAAFLDLDSVSFTGKGVPAVRRTVEPSARHP